jgi:hypothetical protein
MAKKNKFNFTIMYIGQNEKWTIIGFEPRNPETRRRLNRYTMNYDGVIVTTLVVAVPRVLNQLCTWNYYCCKLEILCLDGSPFLVTKGFDALREDHWRRTFNFFLMGPYNTETGNHYIYNHGRNYPKIIRSFFGLIFWLVLHYTCLDSSTINGLKLVGTCNTGDICDRLKVRWDLPLFLLRDFLGFVNLNHSVIHASRKEFDRLIDKPVVKPQNWRNKYICKIIYEFMNFRVN